MGWRRAAGERERCGRFVRARPLAIAAAAVLITTSTTAGSRGLNGDDRSDRFRSAPVEAQPRLNADKPSPEAMPLQAATTTSTAAPAPTSPTTTTTAATATPTTTTALDPGVPPPIAASPPAPPPEVAIVARPIPQPVPATAPEGGAAPPWAGSTHRTGAGHVATDVACAPGMSAGALDSVFRERLGPLIGFDYQHVYPLGDGRFLWLVQDAFIDHPGRATGLGEAGFVHNAAIVQSGTCFTLLHRGTAEAPASFEPGTGDDRLVKWFWPLGGELDGDVLHVFWAEQHKRPDPEPGDGLGWDPVRTWLATYDADSLARLDFQPAPNAGTSPIYGYAVASDDAHSYLFGNSFDQNLADDGGFFAGPFSGRLMYLARVPRGQLGASPEYWTGTGWSSSTKAARPFSDRFTPENPMQPRFIDGQWVSATKARGYWGEELVIEVASDPWGPWTTVVRRPMVPRDGDPAMNTYHAHLMPWRDGGSLVVSVSQNARNMLADAWPHPERYRPLFLTAPWQTVTRPSTPPPTTAPPTTAQPVPTTATTALATTTTATTSTTTTTTTSTIPTTTPTTTSTIPATTTTTTSVPPTSVPPTIVTTTTVAPTTTSPPPPPPCPTTTTSTTVPASTTTTTTTMLPGATTTTTTSVPCTPG